MQHFSTSDFLIDPAYQLEYQTNKESELLNYTQDILDDTS